MNQGRRIVTSKNGRTKDLLLRYPNFVAKSPASSFELTPLACEAGALTTELTALEQTYFSRIFVRRKQTLPALLAAERSAPGPALATRDSLLVTPPLGGELSTQNTERRTPAPGRPTQELKHPSTPPLRGG